MMNRRRLLQLGLGAGTAVTLGGAGALFGAAKPQVAVGSKNFTEQLICGQLVAALLEDAGYPVVRKLRLGGTAICHEALLSGNIDTYVEYTGTALTAILKMPTQADPASVYETVSRAYRSRFKVTWLKPWGFNDTYAIGMRKDTAARLGVKSISDLRGKAESLTLGATQEFIVRPDGLPGLEKAYGIHFKAARGLDFGLMYEAVAKGDVDAISSLSTDGRNITLDLALLQDDRHFFPPYYAAPVVRDATLNQAPQIADVLNRLAGKIDDRMMANLNLLVDQNKRDPADVARTFLKQVGLTKGAAAPGAVRWRA
jgi:osmoprotectant transport system substrate-binding protein